MRMTGIETARPVAIAGNSDHRRIQTMPYTGDFHAHRGWIGFLLINVGSPSSPDFNPIENASAKLKALLRKAAQRTVEGPWPVIGESLTTFKYAECRNYSAAAGYDAD